MCAISDVGFDVPRDFVPDLVVLRAIDSVGDPATKEGANDNVRLSFEGPPELLKKFSKVVNAL